MHRIKPGHPDEGIPVVCRALPARIALVLVMVALIGPAGSVRAESPPPLTVQVLDPVNRPLTGGVVAVCPSGGDCSEYPIDPDGHVHLDRDQLLRSIGLTIVVYDPDGATRFVTSSWTISAADRRLVSNQPQRARGRLQGTTSLGLRLTFAESSAPSAPLTITGTPRPAPSSWLLSVGMVWLVGGAYTADDAALDGVNDVAPGPAVSLGWRPGIPARWPAGQHSRAYPEFSLTYALNRYTVNQVEGPGESDLTFHRISLAAGVGRAWRQTRVAVQGVVGYGGVYDGTTVLERDDRRYGMLGVGISAHATRMITRVAGHRLGLVAQMSAVHYVADENDQDHWYGTAPSLFVGVVSE